MYSIPGSILGAEKHRSVLLQEGGRELGVHPSRVCICSRSTSGQRDLRGHVLAPSINQALGVSLMNAQTLRKRRHRDPGSYNAQTQVLLCPRRMYRPQGH